MVIPVRQRDSSRLRKEVDMKRKMDPTIWQMLHRMRLFFLPILSDKYPVTNVPTILVGWFKLTEEKENYCYNFWSRRARAFFLHGQHSVAEPGPTPSPWSILQHLFN